MTTEYPFLYRYPVCLYIKPYSVGFKFDVNAAIIPTEWWLSGSPPRVAVFQRACDTESAVFRFVWSLGKTNQTRNGNEHEQRE